MSLAEPTKVHPVGWYLRQLDTTEYDSKAAMLAAARQLRQVDVDARKVDMDALKAHQKELRDEQKRINREQDRRKFPTMAQRRYAVRHHTHRWCSFLGLGGCHNTGYLTGSGGVMLKHHRCGGEGVIRVRRGRAPTKRTKGKR